MLTSRIIHSSVCASCRLRGAIAAKQLLRSRRAFPVPRAKAIGAAKFSSSARVFQQRSEFSTVEREALSLDEADAGAEEQGIRYARQLLEHGIEGEDQSPEKAALLARERYGSRLPEGVLGEQAYRVYVRLYGTPLGVQEGEVEEEEGGVGLDEEGGAGTGVLREVRGRGTEEVEFEVEEEESMEQEDMLQHGMVEEQMLEDEAELDVEEAETGMRDDNTRLRQDIETALSAQHTDRGLETTDSVAQDEDTCDPQERAHPLTTATRFGTSPSSLPLPVSSLIEPISTQLVNTHNRHLTDAAHRTLGGLGLPYGPGTPHRAKLLQQKPIQIDAFQHNVSDIEGDVFLAAILPGVYASVVAVLTETRKRLGTAWAESLVRKAEKGELRILDAGGAGAGVLAVREMLRAEWERMHEERSTMDSGMALAEAGGQLGGPGVSPPLGTATVVTGSDVLRHRASKLLENTTFIPRLPDYVHTAEQKSKGKFDLVIAPHTLWGGFRFDRERKMHVQNLWSLLDKDGGVLCLLEKGIARGFEVVAGAREMLLRTRIQSAGNKGTEFDEDSYSGAEIEWEGKSMEEAEEVEDSDGAGKTKSPAPAEQQLVWEKEKGTIIAPCTNHVACPMYRPKGLLKGRRDLCAFEQRYVRPQFLQRILGARDKNYEDLQFSYLSVMRGRDLLEEKQLVQDEEVTDTAFAGYEATTHPSDSTAPSPLQLPRQVLPPLKKKGHVLLDLCTPAGTLERWTVPRSFSRQAFRDARKSRWGDLWALGAKTRVPRHPRMDVKHGGRLSKAQKAEVKGMIEDERAVRAADVAGGKGRRRANSTAKMVEEGMGGVDVSGVGKEKSGGKEMTTVLDTDEYGRVVTRVVSVDSTMRKGKGVRIVPGKVRGEGGRMRTGQKVGGLRDKRDKTGGKGNGRRRMRQDEE